MKILVVSAWYHPFIHPRAHRWTALAEHWAGEGHEVHVVCSRRRNCPEETVVNGVHVHRAGFDSLKEVFYYYYGGKNGRGRVGAAVEKPGIFTRVATWFYNAVWKKLYFPDDACVWYFPAKKRTRQLLEKQRFDLLVTVSLPFTGHLIGLALIRATTRSRGVNTRWLADIGDPFSIQANSLNNSFLYGKISRRLEQKILESADAVTVTTEFTLRKYRKCFGDEAVAKMQVVPPLLHPVPFVSGPEHFPHGKRAANLETLKPLNAETIKIGYFGALYAPVRTPDAFLDLLERTFRLRPDLRGRLEIHFYGEIFPEFYKKLSEQAAIRLHGLRSREEAQAAMQVMDLLLNIGNTTDFQLPSKAVDYLAAGKPVVNLSCADDDPFTAFFKTVQLSIPATGNKLQVRSLHNELIMNLKVKNGRVGEEEVRRWLSWLEAGKKLPDEAERERRIAPFRVEAIAKRYLDLSGC